jgi:hypothetical protein
MQLSVMVTTSGKVADRLSVDDQTSRYACILGCFLLLVVDHGHSFLFSTIIGGLLEESVRRKNEISFIQ